VTSPNRQINRPEPPREGAWRLAEFAILVVSVFALPLAGIALAGREISPYLNFPPVMGKVTHAEFTPWLFAGLALGGLLFTASFATRFFRFRYRPELPGASPCSPVSAFPWWGWMGVGLGIISWWLAWNRFAWLAPAQRHTFTPLWGCYILVVNALTYRRRGNCMLTHNTRSFLALFPVSAAFWWSFEFLNRFVENWHYHGHGARNPVEYFLLGSLAFSTVLPAVLGTRDLLRTFPRLSAPFREFIPVPEIRSRLIALSAVLISTIALILLGILPDLTFPFLWLSPLFLLMGTRVLRRGKGLFDSLATGDWRSVVLLALAAAICGFFWEMWNLHSLARWTYSVPFVHRFKLFEMPVLGYLGYLPFGLECAVVAELAGLMNVEQGSEPSHEN